MIYEEVVKTYGPYQGKDNRLRVILKYKDGHKQLLSYPRYVMEKHLNRHLNVSEQIDHIDENPLNNNLENLQIVSFKEHQKQDAIRNKDVIVRCQYCGKGFTISGSKLNTRNRKDRHQSGYFCSKVCSGKYGREIQLGLRQPLLVDKIIPEKYKVKSAQKETSDVEVG